MTLTSPVVSQVVDQRLLCRRLLTLNLYLISGWEVRGTTVVVCNVRTALRLGSSATVLVRPFRKAMVMGEVPVVLQQRDQIRQVVRPLDLPAQVP